MSDTRKLFCTNVEFCIYVLAENEEQADKIAKRNAADELSNDVACFSSCEVKDICYISKEDRECLPYVMRGTENEKTIGQIAGGSSE